MSFGIEKPLGTAVHYLLLGRKADERVAFQERDGSVSQVPLRQLVRWPPGGTDNQRAVALACGYMLELPGARVHILDHFRRQAVTTGLDLSEPLSASYGHAHLAAAATSLIGAGRKGDLPVRRAALGYLRPRLALALLHADANGFVHSPGARCALPRSEAVDIGLQALLGLPLDPSVNHARWWDPLYRRAAFAEAMRMITRPGGNELLSPAEVRGALAWIRGDLARGEPAMRRLLAGARLTTALVHLRAGANFTSYFPLLECWDNPQPAVTLLGGSPTYLRGRRGREQLWPKGRPIETRQTGGRIEARFVGQLGEPTAKLTAWRDSIPDATPDHTLSICVGPAGATWDSEPLEAENVSD